MEHHETVVGRARLHWVSEGAGADPPFLLIPGWGSSVIKWQDVIPMLATQRRTVALDLPGSGMSEAPEGPYSPAWLAGSVRAFMDAIGIERAILVGNSLGGLVGIYGAAAWPNRCEALVCVAPVLPNDVPEPPTPALLPILALLVPGVGEVVSAAYTRRAPERIVAENLRRNMADPSRASAATVRALEDETRRRAGDRRARRALLAANRHMMWAVTGRRERTWNVVRSLKVPVLFVWGDNDALLPPHIGRRAVEEVPGAHLIVLDECGHNPQMEHPEDFAAAVLSFTRALAARSRES